MNDARQRYYAALDHENTAQRLFEGQQDRSGGGSARSNFPQEETPASLMGVPAPEEVYSELGMRVYRALENVLGQVAGWSRSAGGADGVQLRRSFMEAVQPLVRDLDAMRHRFERQDAVLNEIAAGIRRIDRFTLDAFQRLRTHDGYGDSQGAAPTFGTGMNGQEDYPREYERPVSHHSGGGAAHPAPSNKRLAKEETIARALEAARHLRAQGRKLTLKSVAEAAGLKYSQIVYAFGSKEEMLNQVNREQLSVANAS